MEKNEGAGSISLYVTPFPGVSGSAVSPHSSPHYVTC